MTAPAPMTSPIPPPPSFLRAAERQGIEFDPGDLDRLGLYLALLLEANRSFNLTSITDPDAAWERHVLDSLTLLPLLAELPDGARVIDVGSGGGVPGIPLAITMPRVCFTLLEATGKKAAFLSRTVAALGLTNVEVVHDRAERAGRDRGRLVPGPAGSRSPGRREAYDAVVARAVGRLATIAELCAPLAKVGGRVLLIKGQRADEELAEAAPALHLLRLEPAGMIDTPTGRIVVLAKHVPTPRAYPRADGEPARSPLGLGS